ARRAGMESKMNTGEPLLRAALIQGNIEQRMKWDPEWEEEILETYEDLTRKAVAEAKQNGDLDLVVWPEAAVPFFPTDESAPGWRLRRLVNETGVPILFGAPHYEARRYYNSAFLMQPGVEELIRYDKNILVPFGEYVPLTWLFFFVDKVTEVGGTDFTPGMGARPIELGDTRIGTLICYEGIFPELVRDFERGGSDVLANITNDAWFGNTSAPWQHMATVRMRAIETRSFVLRAANTGITTLIDPLGVAREPTQLNERTYRIVAAGEDLSDTFYEKYGDVVVGLSTLGMLITAGFALIRRKKAPPPEESEDA
ncbi:MAG: apolipoprotein N-acyltransferase, partial [Chrysiogenetes bacterium]|nr:apolipoprotein N-acyltransferase [Chrysiogenetes bacterium]